MRRSSLFWGAVLVIIGLVLLLDNLGLLGNINVWNLLWPLFLIALGIWFLYGTLFGKAPEMEHANVPLEGASRARMKIAHGAGRLNVAAGAGDGDLAVGDFGGGLDLNTRRDGDLLDVQMGIPAQVFPAFMGPGYTLDWNVELNRDIPISLNLETGANDARLDLAELKITDIYIKSGASSTNLILPANAGMTQVRIESGVNSMNVEVPSGVAARVRVHGGLSSSQIDTSRFPRSGDFYQSVDFEIAVNKADIDVQQGVGSVNIR